jgi:SAM-dependent methyltransferase
MPSITVPNCLSWSSCRSALNQWANRIHHPTYWRDHHAELWSLMKKNANNNNNNHSSSPPFLVVATVGVLEEYRNTMDHTVRPTDFVLEVGCHYGTTTALLKEKVAHCMDVDVGSKIIAQAKNWFPGIDFRVGDAWKTAELLRFLQDYKQSYKERMVVEERLRR